MKDDTQTPVEVGSQSEKENVGNVTLLDREIFGFWDEDKEYDGESVHMEKVNEAIEVLESAFEDVRDRYVVTITDSNGSRKGIESREQHLESLIEIATIALYAFVEESEEEISPKVWLKRRLENILFHINTNGKIIGGYRTLEDVKYSLENLVNELKES